MRETIRQIQVLRKDAGFAVEQRIVAEIDAKDEFAKAALTEYGEKIKTDILATALCPVADAAIEREVEVNDSKLLIKLKLA